MSHGERERGLRSALKPFLQAVATMQDHVYARLELLDEMKISIQSKEAARKSSPLRWYGVRVVGWMIALALQALCVLCIVFILQDNGPSFFRLVLGLPHVTLVKLKAFVSYQNYHMILLSQARSPARSATRASSSRSRYPWSPRSFPSS